MLPASLGCQASERSLGRLRQRQSGWSQEPAGESSSLSLPTERVFMTRWPVSASEDRSGSGRCPVPYLPSFPSSSTGRVPGSEPGGSWFESTGGSVSLSKERRAELQRGYCYRQHALAVEYLGGRCVKCGTIEKLEFDHINPITKSFTITKFLTQKPWEEVLAELRKCQLLCENCHKEKTLAEQTGSREHGTWAAYRRGKCRCDVCRDFFNAYRREWRSRKSSPPWLNGGAHLS